MSARTPAELSTIVARHLNPDGDTIARDALAELRARAEQAETLREALSSTPAELAALVSGELSGPKGNRWASAIAALAELVALAEQAAKMPEGREGIVTVYDHHGDYLGCMGIETWRSSSLLQIVQGVIADAGYVLIPKTAEAVDASLRAVLGQRDKYAEQTMTLWEALCRIAHGVHDDDPTYDVLRCAQIARAALAASEPAGKQS